MFKIVFSRFLSFTTYFIEEFLLFIFDVPAFAFSVSVIFCVGFFYDFLRGITVPYFHMNLIAFVALVVGVGAVIYVVFGELFNPPALAGGD